LWHLSGLKWKRVNQQSNEVAVSRKRGSHRPFELKWVASNLNEKLLQHLSKSIAAKIQRGKVSQRHLSSLPQQRASKRIWNQSRIAKKRTVGCKCNIYSINPGVVEADASAPYLWKRLQSHKEVEGGQELGQNVQSVLQRQEVTDC